MCALWEGKRGVKVCEEWNGALGSVLRLSLFMNEAGMKMKVMSWEKYQKYR
jgi:hypothetical protein